MYQRILVAVENSAADRTILTHVAKLARLEQFRAHMKERFAQ